MKIICFVCGLSILAGCRSSPPPATQPSATFRAMTVTQPLVINPAPPTTQQAKSFWLNPPPVVDLAVFRFIVPEGTVSRGDKFWANVNGQIVNDELDEKLQRNGVRVGEGELSDWKECGKILSSAGAAVVSGRFMAARTEDQELVVSDEMPEETLFVFDEHGLSGRSYDHCQNVLSFRYGPSPIDEHGVRLELCPEIRGVRRHYEFTSLNNEQDVEYRSNDYLFNIGLRVDLPEGKFLVIAPSRQADRATSVGHAFLTQDAHAGRRETVYVLVANRALIQAVAATQPAE